MWSVLGDGISTCTVVLGVVAISVSAVCTEIPMTVLSHVYTQSELITVRSDLGLGVGAASALARASAGVRVLH